jgi:glycosyltransferase involved in cell wall biosynthesis
MNSQGEPLVSVVTPVHNCEEYLAECIESVLAQTHSNWEYIIVNNCSTDATGVIAERYARQDNRIKIYRNDKLLPIIANHNKAFSLISGEAKYCKVVSGDDWLFPECIEKMVKVAEKNRTVGIVGSYQLSGSGTDRRHWRVRWSGLHYPSEALSGRSVARLWFIYGLYPFGTPTSLLYRADLVRQDGSFYPNTSPEADTSACLRHLTNVDFAFIHQVLSYERVHQGQISTTSRNVNAYILSIISDLSNYGDSYLTKNECELLMQDYTNQYYTFLAESILARRGRKFWQYHRGRLKGLGLSLRPIKLAAALVGRILDRAFNPKRTVEEWLRSNPEHLKPWSKLKRIKQAAWTEPEAFSRDRHC